MAAPRFRVGDRVRCIEGIARNEVGGVVEGRTYIVRSLDHDGDPILAHESPDQVYGWCASRFELASDAAPHRPILHRVLTGLFLAALMGGMWAWVVAHSDPTTALATTTGLLVVTFFIIGFQAAMINQARAAS